VMKRVLYVIAHPDDEAMFFVPSILANRKVGHDLFLLCLSSGNFQGLGETRKKELEKSCSLLGVKEIALIDSPLCLDGPKNQWDIGFIAQTVHERVSAWGITQIVTFDQGGVSGHQNHIDVYNGVRRYHNTAVVAVPVQCLETTSLLRKYIGPLDILFSFLFVAVANLCGSPRSLCVNASSLSTSFWCMCAHWSQLLWFRYLFIFFSRYAYVNTMSTLKKG